MMTHLLHIVVLLLIQPLITDSFFANECHRYCGLNSSKCLSHLGRCLCAFGWTGPHGAFITSGPNEGRIVADYCTIECQYNYLYSNPNCTGMATPFPLPTTPTLLSSGSSCNIKCGGSKFIGQCLNNKKCLCWWGRTGPEAVYVNAGIYRNRIVANNCKRRCHNTHIHRDPYCVKSTQKKHCNPKCEWFGADQGQCQTDGRCLCWWGWTGPNATYVSMGSITRIKADHCSISCHYTNEYINPKCANITTTTSSIAKHQPNYTTSMTIKSSNKSVLHVIPTSNSSFTPANTPTDDSPTSSRENKASTSAHSSSLTPTSDGTNSPSNNILDIFGENSPDVSTGKNSTHLHHLISETDGTNSSSASNSFTQSNSSLGTSHGILTNSSNSAQPTEMAKPTKPITTMDLIEQYTAKTKDLDQPIKPTEPTDLNQPIKPTEPTDLDQPTEPTEPTILDQPAEPTEPTNLDQSAEPTELTDLDQPRELPEPTDLDQTTEPTEPTDLDQPAEPTEPTDLDQPREPTEHTDLDQPAEPTEPTDLNQPREPTEHTDLDQPREPTKPTDLDRPAELTEQTDLDQPKQPTEHTDLDQLTEPTELTNLNQPTEPTILDQPREPTEPTDLDQSAEPTKPTDLDEPAEPTEPEPKDVKFQENVDQLDKQEQQIPHGHAASKLAISSKGNSIAMAVGILAIVCAVVGLVITIRYKMKCFRVRTGYRQLSEQAYFLND